MQRRLLPVLIVSASTALFGGCAATLQTQDNSSSGARTSEASIVVPPASTHAVVLRMTGSKVATASSDWPRVQTEWREAMQGASNPAGLTFIDETAGIATRSDAGTVVDVYVDDYHFVSQGARIAFGIMTGNAFMRAKVTFRDLQTDQVFGERSYDTKSSAWEGIFAPTTDRQTRAIVADVVKQINPR
ncbi:hypothetical protein OKW50_005078 [Paraburkholderia youngii]|uniref:DUF4410 domain-containing protein n=1 Tax=Paraburkholderia youngii TaxID=2782701 RepID=A0A7W8L0K8_9BURK|nr:hypothetical protein [Paraburkholderia youngii]MBB5398149.1 hypothetical protein [Paraburkholderia youngii]NUX52603.1 hypothetical protein [Paraburkholderia youngii]NVI03136.1 hypothetical protein [Paraburkholderia youngii]